MATLDKYISEIEKGFPLTHYPKTVPKVQDKIVSRITCCPYKTSDMVGIALGPEGVQHAHGDSLIFIQDHLNQFNKNLNFSVIIPKNALTVSYAILSFAVGKSCQEFYPTDRTMPKEAFFTYRMLSKHCQATFYNEGGVQFLAGICYYLQLKDSHLLTTDIDKQAMGEPVSSNIPYPLGDRWLSWRYTNYRYYGRDCKTAGKRVQIKLADGKEPVHRFYNYRTNKYETADCEECREEAKTYKFVPMKQEEQTLTSASGMVKLMGVVEKQMRLAQANQLSFYQMLQLAEDVKKQMKLEVKEAQIAVKEAEKKATVIPKEEVKEEKPATVIPPAKEEKPATVISKEEVKEKKPATVISPAKEEKPATVIPKEEVKEEKPAILKEEEPPVLATVEKKLEELKVEDYEMPSSDDSDYDFAEELHE